MNYQVHIMLKLLALVITAKPSNPMLKTPMYVPKSIDVKRRDECSSNPTGVILVKNLFGIIAVTAPKII